jgi:GNAT superfamily N-acetyltransferase
MSVSFRTYKKTTDYGEDYHKIRNFLIELDSHNYHFGRWDWIKMGFDAGWEWTDPTGLERIGIWEEGDKIVALATYDMSLGSAYLLAFKAYEKLKQEMFFYAKENLAKDGKFRVLILDGDLETQNIAVQNVFYPSQEKECDAIYPIDLEKLKYTLPNGFKITSLKEDFDLFKYGQATYKGFNHEINAEGPFYLFWEKHSEDYKRQWNRPNIDLSLKVFVMAPNGDFVSHCGMWFDKTSKSALVEPVATDPAYRKMGLGKAAVLEGIKRCGELGAERAFVGSSQQFYYNIGFRPYATSTWWKEK